jgi:hypothetical protein
MVVGCGFYSLSATSILSNIKTFQVNYFQNQASLVEPGLDRDFTLALQDIILNQTSLDLVNQNGDYIYEGEITRFYVSPMTATADNTAAQNRLTMEVNLRFYNTKNPEDDSEKRYSFYSDYPAAQQLTGNTLETAVEEIFTQINQDIFNDTLAKW